MNWSNTPAGIIHGAVQRFLVALGDAADTVASQMNRDPSLVARIALCAKSGGFQASTDQKRAREIMGRNMFGVEEAITHFSVTPSRAQFAALAEVPFSDEVLMSVKDTHILVALFPLSICDIRAKCSTDRSFFNEALYTREAFVHNSGEIGWHLICKMPLEKFTSQTWDVQQSLLAENEETPSTQVMVYTMIGYLRATGERLFENFYVRCSDLCSDGTRVLVSNFPDAGGLDIYDFWGNARFSYIGLAVARKS